MSSDYMNIDFWLQFHCTTKYDACIRIVIVLSLLFIIHTQIAKQNVGYEQIKKSSDAATKQQLWSWRKFTFNTAIWNTPSMVSNEEIFTFKSNRKLFFNSWKLLFSYTITFLFYIFLSMQFLKKYIFFSTVDCTSLSGKI